MLWVRPGVLEAKASRCCCVNVLMQVDLPALERPTKAISGTSSRGRCFSSGAVVRNLAVCSQPMAILGSGAAGIATACALPAPEEADGGDGSDGVILGRSLKVDGGRWHAVPAREDDQEGSVSGLGLGLGSHVNACLATLPASHCKIRMFQVL